MKCTNLNKKPLLENLKEGGNNGINSFIDPVKGLYYHQDYDTNSWFAIGHFEIEGHKLDYLVHLIRYDKPQPLIGAVVSITDETMGLYYEEDKAYFLADGEAEISETRMGLNNEITIKTPSACISGNLEKMHIEATIPNCKINIDLKPCGHVLYNGGTGYFPLNGMNVYQYSIPNIDTSGTITIDDKTYDVNGISWFDRQWENQSSDSAGGGGKWTWMDINLDNGDAMSLWSIVNKDGKENAFATVLHPDGSQSVVKVESLSQCESGYWKSSKSGNTYPSHWNIKIPDYDAVLEVVPCPIEQEPAQTPGMAHYEGASTIKGTYKGMEVEGFGFIEVVGNLK